MAVCFVWKRFCQHKNPKLTILPRVTVCVSARDGHKIELHRTVLKHCAEQGIIVVVKQSFART